MAGADMSGGGTEDETDGDFAGEPASAPASEPIAPGEVRLAAGVMALQAVGLVVIALVLLVKTVTGHPDDPARALLDAAFAVVGAAVLVWAGRALVQLRAALRTPVVVLELLALPVGWSLGFQAGRIGYAAPLLVSALGVLYLLFTPAARRVLDRRF